ncbi:MAG: hypothetical protein KGH58_02990 [Candidatus Micrarchaeota archaeon]|nr:hypothetical protein [Candidatus Micrarchaeota archaeon]
MFENFRKSKNADEKNPTLDSVKASIESAYKKDGANACMDELMSACKQFDTVKDSIKGNHETLIGMMLRLGDIINTNKNNAVKNLAVALRAQVTTVAKRTREDSD